MKRTPRQPPPIGRAIADADSALAALRERARELGEREAQIAAGLPAHFAGHWRLAAVSGGRVRLVADSASWATQLRFAAPQVCATLREHGLEGIKRMEVGIGTPPPARPQPRPRILSEPARRTLESAAATQEHAPLANALRRLARRGGG